MGEETQEARNKNFKNYRKNFCSKYSHCNTQEDVLNFISISSDPVLHSFLYSKSSLGARFYHALGARRLSPPLFRILRTRVRNPNERARGNSFVSSRSLIGFSHSRQWPPGIVSSRVRSPPPAPFVGLLTRIYCISL